MEKEITAKPSLSLEMKKYKVDRNNYFKVLNYVNGIRELERWGNNNSPFFIGAEGAIYFITFPNFKKGHIIYTKNLKLSKDEELNKRLIHDLENLLKTGAKED